MQVQPLGQEDPLEDGMVTQSSVFAWRIPWTEEPGGLHGVAESQTRLKRQHADMLAGEGICTGAQGHWDNHHRPV